MQARLARIDKGRRDVVSGVPWTLVVLPTVEGMYQSARIDEPIPTRSKVGRTPEALVQCRGVLCGRPRRWW